MILKQDSVNITQEDLITNAVRILVEAEQGRYTNETVTSMTRIAEGYLRAAEVMQYSDAEYIDLKLRPNYG